MVDNLSTVTVLIARKSVIGGVEDHVSLHRCISHSIDDFISFTRGD